MNNLSKEHMMFSLFLVLLIAIFGTSFLVSDFDPSDNNIVGNAIGIIKPTIRSDELCFDTDGGVNTRLQGIVSFKDNNFVTVNKEDTCSYNPVAKKYELKEYYCEFDRDWVRTIPCEYGCYNGKCLESNTCMRSNPTEVGSYLKRDGVVYNDYLIHDNGGKEKLASFCDADDYVVHARCNENTHTIFYTRQHCSLGCMNAKTGEGHCGDR